MMRAQFQQFGPYTCEKLIEFRHALLSAYEVWIDRSKVRGDFADVATDIAALFFDAQHGGAMRMQREGVPNDTIAHVLGTGLRMPISNANIIGF